MSHLNTPIHDPQSRIVPPAVPRADDLARAAVVAPYTVASRTHDPHLSNAPRATHTGTSKE